MKKYLQEFFGTAILVFVGCGAAMLSNPGSGKAGAYILTAICFGAALIISALFVAKTSGCHINPAVSLCMYFQGKLNTKDFICYVVAQCLGAIFGSFLTAIPVLFKLDLSENYYSFATNSAYGVWDNSVLAFLVELVLTFAFLQVVLKYAKRKTGGIYIGIALCAIHLVGIALTGTSVNPARSLGPAIIRALVAGETDALEAIWIFIVAPLCAGLLAGMISRAEKEGK